ncbi:MAG: helix-turn-helix transcriptional regulator [Burkholderiales bacterium]|nr:helix-turn-helix transcriptional regulator [Burkholderiales bacterium]
MTAPATVWVRDPQAPLHSRARPDRPGPTSARQDRVPGSAGASAPAGPATRPSVNEAVVCSLVGSNLRRLRKQQRFSLEQLAAHSGVSRAMLGQVEQGKSIPSIKTLWQVAKALGVSVSWFLESTHDDSVLLLQPPPDSPFTLPVRAGELRPLQQARDGHHDAFYELRLAPGASLSLPVAMSVRRVNVVVSTGVLDVILEGQRHLVRPRETLQYEAVDQLVWRNNGQVQVQAFVLIRGSASRDAAR